MGIDDAKKAAACAAAGFIESGMIVGLGTGTTAAHFIHALIERCKQGLQIQCVASSHQSAHLAQSGKLSVLDINASPRVDVTIDGADQIDSKKRMIKGGGGAHVREKILASSSGEMIVIVDDAKVVKSLGKTKLPVEILPYGAPTTRKRLEDMGFTGQWRVTDTNSLFVTENGNLLFDIVFSSLISDPEGEDLKISLTPGVVDTGFFFNLAGRVIVGHLDGTTELLH